MMQPPKLKRPAPKYTEKQLWEKYLIVTSELLKFIKAEDIDTFLDLVDQRQRLMEMMQALPEGERDFSSTPECDAMREQIKPMDMQIIYKAKTWLNKSKRQNMAVKSYDITGYMPAGNVFNREY